MGDSASGGCLQPSLGRTHAATALSVLERVSSSHSTQLVRGAGVGETLWKSSLQCRGSILFFFFFNGYLGVKILGKLNILWVTHSTATVPILFNWALGSFPFALLMLLSPLPPHILGLNGYWCTFGPGAGPRQKDLRAACRAGCREGLGPGELPRPVRSLLISGACGHRAPRVLRSVSTGSDPAATLPTLGGGGGQV